MVDGEVIRLATSQGAVPKPVQELVQEVCGPDVPERYLNRVPANDPNPVDDASLPMMAAAAMIDFGRLTSPLSSQRADELAKLRSALSSWGCFQLVNHGMSSGFLDQLRQATRQFFALPQQEKNKYARAADQFDGYGNDDGYGGNTVDWNDRVELWVHPENRRALSYWPDSLKVILDEYTVKSKEITTELLKAMAVSLGLEENCFVDMYGQDANMLARFNYYPACPRPDLVFGIRPHTDATFVTFVLPDDQVEALQVRKDGEWYRVATIPHALFIIAGDQTEMMTNGLFKGGFHRVVTLANKDRISLIMFCLPESDLEIKPPAELITEERPQKYRTVKNYVLMFYKDDPLGHKRPIDTVRIHDV